MIPTIPVTPRVASTLPLNTPAVHTCDYCGALGTTASGGLWRVSPGAGDDRLYFLHSGCVRPYKVAHGLQSVEGCRPRAGTR